MDSPVGACHILTVGTVQVRPNNVAGRGTAMLWWTFTSRTWTEPLPVHAFVIEHEQGNLLFDTGQAPASGHKSYFPGGLVGAVYARQVRSHNDPDQTLAAQLASAGMTLESISLAAVSHLHYDHAGNVDQLGSTPILVAEAEHALLGEKKPEMHGVLVGHVAPEAVNYQPVTFAATDAVPGFDTAHDIHRDGSLMLLPTPGHSPGSMSLLVRRGDRAPLLLVGDVTYDPDLLERSILPDVGDRDEQRRTAQRIATLKAAEPELVILAAHDPLAAQRLRIAS